MSKGMMMSNDIQITVENVPKQECDGMDDEWDPMKEEFNNPDVNCYDHGPGANLDINLQRPAYRDRNNQIVYKVMVSRIPRGLEQTGLENLFRNVGVPTVAKCHKNAPNALNWALIEFKTLLEAKRAVVELDTLFGMRVNFARSDEENERLRKKKLEEDKLFNQMMYTPAPSSNDNIQTTAGKCQSASTSNLKLLKMLGRGQSRGKMIFNAFRGYQEKRPGLKHCAWSSGVPDMRDPGGFVYDAKSSHHELSNKVTLQNIIVTAGSGSVRQVSMGRGFIPPHQEATPIEIDLTKLCVGTDVTVPLRPCTKCGTQTIEKCSLCGDPYCTKRCQRDDFGVHKTRCRPKATIDVLARDIPYTSVLVPITKKIDQVPTSSFSSNLPSVNPSWGKPTQNVVALLRGGTEAIVSVTEEQPTQLCGSLGCNEVFDITNKLLVEMPASVMQQPTDLNFWPSIGALVAVRWDGSIWRGYILNTPLVGNSLDFTVALCDLGSVKKIAAHNIMPLPSDYYDLPELAVTCSLVEVNAQGSTIVPDKQLFLKIENQAGDKLFAKAMSVDGLTELGIVTVSPWNPPVNDLIGVQVALPCSVVLSAYHNQHVLYVRPTGRLYKEQFFCLMQKVAAIHTTSPPLGRAPYKEEMVACKYEKDGNYYRGIVREESSLIQGYYEVFFVDFGNIEPISNENMKALPHELKSCPCMAIPVQPYGVRDGPLTDNAVQFLNTLLQKQQEFQMDYASQTKQGGVQLIFPDKSSLNLQLNELLAPKWEESLKSGSAINYNDQVTMYQDLNVVPLVEGEAQKGVATVMVMNVSSTGRLAVLPMGPAEVEHVLKTVAFQINEYCESTNPSERYNPRVNEICLAKYQKDGQWYRAVNLETLTETQSSKLLFIDYGNVENVPFGDIRQVVSDFTSAPVVMSMCCLEGAPMEPTPDVVQRIRELVPTKTIYEVEVLGRTEGYEYKISIPQISNQLKSELSVSM